MMEWTQEPPVDSGIYLRVNAGHRVVKHTVSDGYINWGWSSVTDGEKAIPVSHEKVQGFMVRGKLHRWWWLGPLPFPPPESGIDGFSWARHPPVTA